ncbi:uncharacterized protein [Antedon mediterranea]|uniref:uncharacterized protein n=1 Tax=Antedon mediterranea TaxID=105859 RepID=UPI003AF77508
MKKDYSWEAIKRCTALRTGDKVAEQGDKVAEQEAKSFLKLKEAEWAEQISAEVLGTISKRKFKQVTELPESADLSKFTTFLIENIKDATDELKKPSAKTFRRCCQLVLARLTTFNKRRTGETEQLSLESCINRTNWEASSISDLKNYLTSLESHLGIGHDFHTWQTWKEPIIIPSGSKRAWTS